MSRNEELFEQAQQLIPGGVNSPVRAFRSVGGTPLFFKRGEGAYVWDADGKRYIDYVGSWGPMIVGHAHPEVVRAVQAAAARTGCRFGAPTEAEIEMAELLCKLLPSHGNGAPGQFGHRGDDDRDPPGARLHRARAIIKFEGCYHGHADSLLVKAGSGALTFGQPTFRRRAAGDRRADRWCSITTMPAGWKTAFAEDGNEIAA